MYALHTFLIHLDGLNEGYEVTQKICRKIVYLEEKQYILINCITRKKSIQPIQKVRPGARAAVIVTFELVE
jgi:hypothetical protein